MIVTDDAPPKVTFQTLEQRQAFMRLPLEKRRRIMTEQAELLAASYNEDAARAEREIWQGGDILEFSHT